MRKCLTTLLVCLTYFFMLGNAKAKDPDKGIIPQPVSAVPHSGAFILTHSTTLIASGKEAEHVADMFNQFLKTNYGFTLLIMFVKKDKCSMI